MGVFCFASVRSRFTFAALHDLPVFLVLLVTVPVLPSDEAGVEGTPNDSTPIPRLVLVLDRCRRCEALDPLSTLASTAARGVRLARVGDLQVVASEHGPAESACPVLIDDEDGGSNRRVGVQGSEPLWRLVDSVCTNRSSAPNVVHKSPAWGVQFSPDAIYDEDPDASPLSLTAR